MSSRQSKRNLATEFGILEGHEHGKRDVGTNTDEHVTESVEEPIEMIHSPVFNIHIHVPASDDNNTTKMYLPRIQPIIHLHFDELAKKLGNSAALQNGGLSQMNLQNLLSKSTPKFGKVLFHYKDNSFKRDVINNVVSASPRKLILKDKSPSIDLEPSTCDDTKVMRTDISEITDQTNNNNHEENSNENTNEEVSCHKLSNDPPIKLRKAVVVLNDICKSKSYKGAAPNDLVEHEENKIVNNSSLSLLRELLSLNALIKKENSTSGSSEKVNDCSGHLCKNLFSSKCCGTAHCNFIQKKSVESLIEGCNFSEILRRFRSKSQKCNDDASEKLNFVVERKCMMECDKRLDDKNESPTRNNVETQNEKFCHHHALDQGAEQNKNGVNLSENYVGGVELSNTKIHSPPKNKNLISSDSEASEFNTCTEQGFIKKVGAVMKENEIVRSINEFHVADAQSDNGEITTRNKLSSVIVEDLKSVEFASPSKTDAVIKTVSDVGTDELSFVDKDHIFDLKLMDKEVTMTDQGVDKIEKHEKRKLRDAYELRSQPRNESSSKKIKQSPETLMKTSKESPLKPSGGEDFMSLKVSGSTAFAVAPLQNVPAYKTHDARNFRNDMLFGNRVNRFSSSDQLHVYKLKKQAAGRRFD